VEAAAQMEMLSEPGGVCVTQSVWEQVAARIDVRFEPLPHAVLAGSAWRGFRAALRRPEGAVR
jgi:class 3 adenylate cyclase